MGPIVIPDDAAPAQRVAAPAGARARVLRRGTRGRPGRRDRCRPGSGSRSCRCCSAARCYFCRRGLNHLCTSRWHASGLSYDWGGIAERAVVPATHVTPLPDGVTDLQGALVEPTAVAAYGVDVAQVRPGDTRAGHRRRPDRRAGRALRGLARRPGRDLRGEPGPAPTWPAGSTSARCSTRAEVDVVGVAAGADRGRRRGRRDRVLRQRASAADRARPRSARPGGSRRPACTPGPPSIDPMTLSEHDITLAGTWCYPVTDWPRIIDLIARRTASGREGGDRAGADGRRRRARLRGAAVADRRPGQGAGGGRAMRALQLHRAREGRRSPSSGAGDRRRRGAGRRPRRSGSATPTSNCSRAATSSRSPTR